MIRAAGLASPIRSRMAAHMNRRSLLLLPLALAGCAAPRPKPVVAAPAPPPVVALPAPVLSNDWRDWPFTPGAWTYAAGTARFGVAGRPPELTLRCERATGVVALVRAAPPAAAPRSVRITATGAERTLTAVDRADGATLSLAARRQA
ncbi:MAG: hypothetical protein EOO66_17535, partial [Methylobacterium sp.]